MFLLWLHGVKLFLFGAQRWVAPPQIAFLVDGGPLCGPAKGVGGPTKLAPFLVSAPASSLESLFSA